MAQSRNNVITHGLSGTIGDTIVFRQRGGKTIVAALPKQSDSPSSPQQQQTRIKFQQAVIYGKAAVADPNARAAYAAQAKPGQSAYNVAVADFFNAPDIDTIDVSAYFGNIGDTITVRVTDDFQVAAVQVKIEDPNNNLVEQGAATPAGNGLEWIYTATAANGSVSGDKITITATDTPNNTTTQISILP